MTGQQSISRRVVFFGAAFLFVVWVAMHLGALTATQNGLIRFVLTALFGILILTRPKRASEGHPYRAWAVTLSGTTGAALAVLGLVFGVRQFEWIGMILLLYSCFRWSLPDIYAHDVKMSLFVLYWAHPVPGRIFGALQAAMQHLSIRGTEWFLHLFNVRVWADGIQLRTGIHAYEVPDWCSGMRTATTVVLLGLGLGVLRRLKLHEIAVVMVAALAQALVLNVLRIASMVLLVPSLGAGSGYRFLHDTTGAIVLVAVLLVFLEILAWERYTAARQQHAEEINKEQVRAVTAHPPFWRDLGHHRGWMVTLILLATFIATLVYRSRPHHRAQMYRDVAEALRDAGHLENAERLAAIVGRMMPEDLDWQLDRVRLLILRGRYEDVLTTLDVMPRLEGGRRTEQDILRAYALMALRRMDEASELVHALPRTVRESDPRVAMILAEMSLLGNDPNAVASNIIIASHWTPNMPRIRSLYPYLRGHRKWQAIGRSDRGAAFRDPSQAMSAAEAYMNLNQPADVARILLDAVQTWPEDPRLIEPLFFMVLKHHDPKWEGLFSSQVRRCVALETDCDILNNLFQKCFQLTRPDLAWLVYDRIRDLDARHPALHLAVARYGNVWFTFRRHYLGMSAARADDTTDITDLLFAASVVQPDVPWWSLIPEGRYLAGDTRSVYRARALELALAEFARRDAAGTLTLPMEYEYAMALELDGKVDAARARLDGVLAKHPGEENTVLRVLSEIYERGGAWQSIYELLRGYHEGERLNLNLLLRLVQSQLNLRLGQAAMYTASIACEKFPQSTLANIAYTTALLRHASAEEALLVLDRPRLRHQRDIDLLEAEALYRSQRFAEAEALCQSALLPRRALSPDLQQTMLLPPAELAALWHRVYLPTQSDFERNADVLHENLETGTSPFLTAMMTRWLEAFQAECGEDSADPERWLACGRDRIEKATSLNQLTLLLCWQERFAEAREIAARAADLFPEAPLLWHILISLTGADPSTIQAARKACPTDSEIWLADLVARTQASIAASDDETVAPETAAWVEQQLVPETTRSFTPASLTRAGEYLYRIGLKDLAATSTRLATGRARGLLPTFVLGIRCALTQWDREWAIDCTRRAIDSSLVPPPIFFRTLVELKSSEEELDIDSDMVLALTTLRRDDPANPMWAQMLGYVRFQRGGWEIVDALYQMTAALEGGATNRTPYIIAAEASRLLGNFERSADLLRRGLESHPGDTVMLNNLIYTLTFSPETIGDAIELLPELMEKEGDNPYALDTVTVAYLRARQLEQALQKAEEVMDATQPGSRLWFRANVHAAEVSLRRSRPHETISRINRTLSVSRGIPDEDIVDANRLLARAREAARREQDE